MMSGYEAEAYHLYRRYPARPLQGDLQECSELQNYSNHTLFQDRLLPDIPYL